jgi:uncharacterized protein (DUF2236 family)
MLDSPAIVLPGAREALASLEALIGNCVADMSEGDHGLFGPRSVTWRIVRNPSYGISAIAALLWEALHPVAMAAIDQHSDYRLDAWRRAHRTTDYVFTITFGGTDRALKAAERVRSIHERIAGTDPFTGRAYRADDPGLLLWIHCVNTETAIRGQETFGGGISKADADRFVREQVRAASLVGLHESAVPANRRDLREAIAALVTPSLSPPAAEFARLLLNARMPLSMRPFWAIHVAGAVALIPPEARRLYDFPPWIPTGAAARAAIRMMLRAIDIGYGLAPGVGGARRRIRLLSRASV